MDRQDYVGSPQDRKPPELQDFQVTPEEYALYSGKGDESLKMSLWFLGSLVLVLGLVSLDVWIIIRWENARWEDAFELIFVTGLWGGILGGGVITVLGEVIESAITGKKRRRLLQSPVAARIERYEAAVAAHQETQVAERARQEEAERRQREAERQRYLDEKARQEEAERWQREAERQRYLDEKARQETLLVEQRKKEKYWQSLGGVEFEEELAKLFRSRGYQIQTTPKSGDQGIDLIAKKNGKTAVVQCKRYKGAVGPAVVRELYGSMVAYGADEAILACTGGFTKGVVEFAQGKPIRLVDVWDIVHVADAVADKSTQNEQSKWPQNDAWKPDEPLN